MRLLRSTKKGVDSDKNSENVPKLESVEVVLVHCNLLKNDHQHSSKVLFSFVPNKQFGQLMNISANSLIIVNIVNTEFYFVEVSFTDQARKFAYKYGKKLMDAATKTGIDAAKSTSKRVVQKTAEGNWKFNWK